MVAAVVCLAAAAVASVPTLLYVTGLLLGLVGAALVLVVLAPVRLAVAREFSPEEVAVGDEATVRLTFTRSSRLVPTSGTWSEILPRGVRGVARGDLPPLSRANPVATAAYTVRPTRRGRPEVGPVVLEVTDPFDLVRRRVQVGGTDEMLVVPARVDLQQTSAGPHRREEDSRWVSVRPGRGEDDVVARPHRPGDSLARTHWKATARRGSLMVRQEEEPSDVRSVVVLDVGAGAHAVQRDADGVDELSDSLEWAVVAAASILTELLRTGHGAELLTSDGRVRRTIGDGHDDVSDALVDLALVEPDRGRGLSVRLDQLPGGGPVLVLGDLDARSAADWLTLVPGPARALVGAASERDARRLLRDAGWHTVTYRPGDDLLEAWTRLVGSGAP